MHRTLVALSLCTVFLWASPSVSVTPASESLSSPAARRQALIEAAQGGEESLTLLGAALDDEDALVRQTAFRLLVEKGSPAVDTIKQAMQSKDANLRRMALTTLSSFGELSTDDLEAALSDPEETIRVEAVRLLSAIRPRTPRINDLVAEAGVDPSPRVRAAALKGMFGKVSRASLREEHGDRSITVAKTVSLPAEGWKLKFDPDGMGHGLGWFRENFDDSHWEKGRIETPWETGYIGVGWYRLRFDMPEKESFDGVELHFEGVDECAWVWVNGQYAGEHDVGTAGWNIPFSLDITDLVQWKAENQITVRAMNTAHAGGIWRPVQLHFLRLQ